MPAIYGGSPEIASMREEEIAAADFVLQDAWGAHSRTSSLRVGTRRVEVRREPRGWVGVVHDMDTEEPLGREVWRDTAVWIREYDAAWRAEKWLREHGGAWCAGQVRYSYIGALDGSFTKYRTEVDGSETLVGRWASWAEMQDTEGSDE